MNRLDIKKCIIIPDIHGCYEEFIELIDKLKQNGFDPTTDLERKFVFLGDWIDRGDYSDKVIEYICDLIDNDLAVSVIGNHEDKLLRYLKGNNIKLKNGIEMTVEQIERRSDADKLKATALRTLQKLPLFIALDDGKLVAVHAAFQDRMLKWDEANDSGFLRRFCIFGDITGNKDEYGFPERRDWTLQRRIDDSSPLIVYGHQPQVEPYESNKTINLDCGVCFGGKLMALTYPEMKYFSVPAKKEYWEFKNGQYRLEQNNDNLQNSNS